VNVYIVQIIDLMKHFHLSWIIWWWWWNLLLPVWTCSLSVPVVNLFRAAVGVLCNVTSLYNNCCGKDSG